MKLESWCAKNSLVITMCIMPVGLGLDNPVAGAFVLLLSGISFYCKEEPEKK